MKPIKGQLEFAWTDHNLHDPGVTLLEHLRYAISDLTYRLGFRIEDMLTESGKKELLPYFTAREILPQAPLTLLDYRKLLIDIPGVKNAWLQVEERPGKGLRYIPNTGESVFLIENDEGESEHSFYIKGFLNILIEPEKGVLAEELLQRIQEKLAKNRTLSQDFFEITLLPEEPIGIEVAVELHESAEPASIEAELAQEISHWISPAIPFYNLSQMLQMGFAPDDIFSGPLLDHGFIREEELKRFDKKRSLRASDLLHLLMDLPDVKLVRNILMWKGNSPTQLVKKEKNYLSLSANQAPKLDELTIHFFRNGRLILSGDLPTLEQVGNNTYAQQPGEDMPIPDGKYRDLGHFYSLAHDFPNNYGIGFNGLPEKASESRRAQAKQLKAYLAFFEQLLANYLGQLDHARHLFALNYTEDPSYFPQALWGEDGIPDYRDLLQSPASHVTSLEKLSEDKIRQADRHNRRLNHLLARFAERYPEREHFPRDIAFHKGGNESSNHKHQFLLQYSTLTCDRGKAFNYRNAEPAWMLTNISGLERKIQLLLGIGGGKPKAAPRFRIEIRPPISDAHETSFNHRFVLKSVPEGRIILSSWTAYADRISCQKALWWALRLASRGEGFDITTTDSGKYYFRIINPEKEKVAQHKRYFSNKEDVQKAIDDLVGRVQSFFKEEDFYLLEHLLIGPKVQTLDENKIYQPTWKTFIHNIYKFKTEPLSNLAKAQPELKKLWCESPDHKLKVDDQVEIMDAGLYCGRYEVKQVRPEMFAVYYRDEESPKEPGVLEPIQPDPVKPTTPLQPVVKRNTGKSLERAPGPPVGRWIQLDKKNYDSWSLQLSLVFPGWVEEFSTRNSRNSTEELIQAETPSHITPYVCWIEKEGQMIEFLAHYHSWREKTATGIDATMEVDWLNEFLGISMRYEAIHGLQINRSTDKLKVEQLNLPFREKQVALSFWMRIDELKFREDIPSPDTFLLLEGISFGSHGGNVPILMVGFKKNQVVFKCCLRDFVIAGFPTQSHLGEWMHFVFYRDFENDLMSIYVNGELLVEEERSETFERPLYSFWIEGASGTINFSGTFADCRIWSSVPNVSDILESRFDRLEGTESGLFAYWKLDESEGKEAKDSVVHIINGEEKTNIHPLKIEGCKWV